jgi:hypothetical protein
MGLPKLTKCHDCYGHFGEVTKSFGNYYPIPGVWQLFRYLAFYSSNTEPPVFKLPKNMWIFGLCMNIKFVFEKVYEKWRRSTSGAQKRKVPGDWKRCNGESHQHVHIPHVGCVSVCFAFWAALQTHHACHSARTRKPLFLALHTEEYVLQPRILHR